MNKAPHTKKTAPSTSSVGANRDNGHNSESDKNEDSSSSDQVIELPIIFASIFVKRRNHTHTHTHIYIQTRIQAYSIQRKHSVANECAICSWCVWCIAVNTIFTIFATKLVFYEIGSHIVHIARINDIAIS